MVGYFEGIDSKRGIDWRCNDSISLKLFFGVAIAPPSRAVSPGGRQKVSSSKWAGKVPARVGNNRMEVYRSKWRPDWELNILHLHFFQIAFWALPALVPFGRRETLSAEQPFRPYTRRWRQAEVSPWTDGSDKAAGNLGHH